MRLTKLFRLKNTGLFLNGLPDRAIDLPRIVLTYGENGRGKTTLSEVLRSLATGRSELLEGRRSVDADGEPEVALRWEHDGDSGTIQFSDDRWSEGFGPLSVYDAPWVHENVHTGELLEPSHRDALLELALGSAAVTAKRAVEQANTSARDAKKEANAKRKTVEAYARPYTVEDFVKLDPEEDRSAEMERAQQELVNVRKADSIRRRPRPATLAAPADISDEVVEQVTQAVPEVADQARRALAAAHMQALHGDDETVEDWIRTGRGLVVDASCPFCGQALAGVDLVEAYAHYFSKAYEQLLDDVAQLRRSVQAKYGQAQVDALARQAETNTERLRAWAEDAEVETSELDAVALRDAYRQMQEALDGLIERKVRAPLASPSLEPSLSEFRAAYAVCSDTLTSYNDEIERCSKCIATFLGSLSATTVADAEKRVQLLQAASRRATPETVAAIAEHAEATRRASELASERDKAKEELDRAEGENPRKYRDEVNRLLLNFGAAFRIRELNRDTIGGQPRARLVVELRQRPVDLAKTPSMGSVLSEGDRRSLALAFFLASVGLEPDVAGRVVVVDDALASLDATRRRATLRELLRLTGECAQLVVLSHDPHALRDLRDEIKRTKTARGDEVAELRISSDGAGGAVLTGASLDSLCESGYAKNTRLLRDWCEGNQTGDVEAAAQAVRKVVEGWLHRRYPTEVPRGDSIGDIIDRVRRAPDGSPLSHCKPLLAELNAINAYANGPHHDADVDCPNRPTDSGEVAAYARRALNLVWGASDAWDPNREE